MNTNETRPPSGGNNLRPLARIRKSVKETVSGMRTLLGQMNINRSTQQLRESKRQKHKRMLKIIIVVVILIAILGVFVKRVF